MSERAYSFLQGIEQIDDESKKIYLSGPNSAKRVATDLAWFLSLSGPTLLAFDQLDPFVAQNNLADPEDTTSLRMKEALHVLFDVVNGMMAVRGEFAKTLMIITCLESSWNALQKRAVDSFKHRFEEIELLDLIRDPGTPQGLVEGRLTECYRRANFTPTYPAWPFARGFFKSLPPGLTPREILNRCDSHRLACVRAGKVTELGNYSDFGPAINGGPDLSELDRRFSQEFAAVDTRRLLDQDGEDQLGDILGEAARLFRLEVPPQPNIDLAVDADFHETRQFESLHLRMRRIFRVEGDREEHVCVRILQKTNARAFQVRLSAALTTSGMSEKLDGRRLFLLRNAPPPSGAETVKLVKRAIEECGAEFLPITAHDVQTLAAVVALSKCGDSQFENLAFEEPAAQQDNVVARISTHLAGGFAY